MAPLLLKGAGQAGSGNGVYFVPFWRTTGFRFVKRVMLVR